MGLKLSKNVKTRNVNLNLFKFMFYVSTLYFMNRALTVDVTPSPTLRKCVV